MGPVAPQAVRPTSTADRRPRFRPRGEARPARGRSDAKLADHRAAELIARVPVADGLRICLALADERSPHHAPAALRCHSRLLHFFPRISLADAQASLAALAGLRASHRYAAAETLREIYERCEQQEAVEVLDAWIVGPPSDARSGGPTSAHARIELEARGR